VSLTTTFFRFLLALLRLRLVFLPPPSCSEFHTWVGSAVASTYHYPISSPPSVYVSFTLSHFHHWTHVAYGCNNHSLFPFTLFLVALQYTGGHTTLYFPNRTIHFQKPKIYKSLRIHFITSTIFCGSQFLKIAVIWVICYCSLSEVYWRFRGAYCLHHQVDNSGTAVAVTSVFCVCQVVFQCNKKMYLLQRTAFQSLQTKLMYIIHNFPSIQACVSYVNIYPH
jgi:hypothetical protein